MTQSWEPDGLENQAPLDELPLNEEEYELEVPSFARSSRRRPAILLITVFAGGLAAIIIMRTLTGGIGQVMADTGIEEAVSGFLDFMREGSKDEPAKQEAKGDPFADLVTDHYAAMQVSPDALKSNPFVTPWTTSSNINFAQSPVLSITQQRRLRREELEDLVDVFDTQSIMTGSKPIATINEQIVQIGDELETDDPDAICILREVNSEAVVIEARDDNFDLSVMLTVVLRSE
ncbi:MAG: hypothetical protein CMJ29_11360 [Phycisphaerae bacterium]|nr:hypothetical protein [Phycisphaerae bacterium]